MARKSSLCEKPISHSPRRLAAWLNPTGARKVHSLVDKVYARKNLALAWEKVRKNRGAGGVDGQSIQEFEEEQEEQLDKLHEELKQSSYQPQPVREKLIPKAGQPGKYRKLGIPAVYDRVCQQALLNRVGPIAQILEMLPTSDTEQGDRARMRCARSGGSWRMVVSGSWTLI
jgi:RNA-directed DNA polymerase